MNLRDILYEEVLPRVQKPSRYLGTELNRVQKNPASVELRIALVFPDLYDLGLGNLGILILYAILNRLEWCWAERVYAPAPDMEAELRRRGLPLFALESKDPLGVMDGIGFTLQSELTYTSILNALDLAGLPLRAENRADAHPLVFAGGPAVFNPEPMAPFFDFFVIGEGEEVILEIAEVMRAVKGQPRRRKLEALAVLDGVYVPRLYPFEELDDGRIVPVADAPKIVKRLVRNFDEAAFPTDYIVPYTHQVHDRVSLEVLRGCTQGCRFCQAGMVTRPVRERRLEKIDELMERTLASTGYEEVSLVSLSTCDYSRPRTLVQQAAQRAQGDRVSVSLSSLRLDSFSVELADMVAGVRRSGLTFAPESGTPRLRAVINKWIPDEPLLDMSIEAFRRGWGHVKFYFMIGLPTERDEDVEAIVELCKETVEAGRIVNRRARVHTGVSTFVPRPFTPFQWAEQISIEETERRQAILERGFRGISGIKFGRHNPASSFVEGLIARADRRAAELIEAAWRRGARLDSWDEHLDLGAWRGAIDEVGFNVQEALRARDLDERLPWDHIDILVPKQWLQQDWAAAMELKHAPDCRQGQCRLCGVIDREPDLCRDMIKRSLAGRKAEADWKPPSSPPFQEPPPVQRIRFRIGRRGEVRFLSHLELVNVWVRALRRIRAPLSYSQGFHAHPKVNFSSAPPVGEESVADYMDIVLYERVDPAGLLERLRATLPDGIHVFSADQVALNAPSLMSSTTGFSYTICAAGDGEQVKAHIREFMGRNRFVVERLGKPKGRGKRKRRAKVEVNVRPMVRSLSLREVKDGQLVVDLETMVVNTRSIRPSEVVAMLGLDPVGARILKRETRLAEAPVETAV